MDLAAIDQAQLNFNPQGLFVINAAIGLMMLGVALELKLEDFKRILVAPKAPLIGLAAQFVLLPALTFGISALVLAVAVAAAALMPAVRSLRARGLGANAAAALGTVAVFGAIVGLLGLVAVVLAIVGNAGTAATIMLARMSSPVDGGGVGA